MNDLVKQRIKYLVEYGELYPIDGQTRDRKLMWGMFGILVLQIITDAILLIR